MSEIRNNKKGVFPVWGHFSCLVGIFFITTYVGELLPTPGSWSDHRSHWMMEAVVAIVSLGLFIAVHWLWRRTGIVYKVQAILLWMFFGFACGSAMPHLYESAMFFRGLKQRHEWQDRQNQAAHDTARKLADSEAARYP